MIKSSHYRTPRTMDECHFVTGYRSSDRSEKPLIAMAKWFGLGMAFVVLWAAAKL